MKSIWKLFQLFTDFVPREIPKLGKFGIEILMLPRVGVSSGISKPNIVTYEMYIFGMIIWSGRQIKFSELFWRFQLTCVGKQIRNSFFLAQCKPICRWTQKPVLQENDGLASCWWATGAAGNSKNFQNVAIGRVNEVFLDWVALGSHDLFLESRFRLQTRWRNQSSFTHGLLGCVCEAKVFI